MKLKAAYIVPHPPLAVPAVGRGQERVISATLTAYREVARRIVAHAPEVLVCISPHSAYYADWIYIATGDGATGDFRDFGVPGLRFALTYDRDLGNSIAAHAHESGIPAGPVEDSPRPLDHGLMVPLYFIEEARAEQDDRWRYEAVSIGGSALPREVLREFGRCVFRAIAAQDKSVVLVVSGDLSHRLLESGPYGFNPAGPRFDEQFASIIKSGDLQALTTIDPGLAEDAAECGLSGFIMLAGALDEAFQHAGQSFSSELLSCEGPFGVGYGVAAFEAGSPDKEADHDQH